MPAGFTDQSRPPVAYLTPRRLAFGVAFLVAFSLLRVLGVYAANFAQLLTERRPAAQPAAQAVAQPAETHYLRDINQNTDIPAFEARFTGVKERVPPHTTLGYLSDGTPAQIDGDATASAAMVLARYALAPRQVLNDPGQEWVVGSFDRPETARQVRPPGLTLVADYGNGVALFRRSTAR